MPRNALWEAVNVSDSATRYNINGRIGDWGNTSEDLIYHLEYNEASEIEVVIQSPGGVAFEGIAIYSVLKAHKAKVTTRVLGAAASAGSIIFMAGDVRVMPHNTYLMIHEPSLNITGKAKDLREAADFLEGLTSALHSTYSPYVNVSDSKLTEMLLSDTWIRAPDALDMGFATTVEEPLKAVAYSSEFAQAFNSLPWSKDSIAGAMNSIGSVRDLEKFLRESGGFSRDQATALVSKMRSTLQSESADDLAQIANALDSFSLNF